MDAVSDILDDLAVRRLEFAVLFPSLERQSSESCLGCRLVFFSVPSDLFSLQVVVEIAEQEQGAIEPLLLLGFGVETISEG